MFYIGYNQEVGGIGDFVYIIFQYYYFYVSNGIITASDIKICIPEHSLKNCIECIEYEPKHCKKIRAIAHSNVSNIFIHHIYSNSYKISPILIYSNMNDFLHICIRHASKSMLSVLRREFREKVFCISPRVLNFVDHLITCSPISNSKIFSAIHIRCGDKYLRKYNSNDIIDDRCSPGSDELYKKVDCGVNFLRRAQRSIPIFIFCDNEIIKNDLAERFNCYTFNIEIVHIVDTDKFSDKATIDTFSEFVLLSRATEIFAVSISNFSRVPAFIYDIPIYTIDMDNIVKCVNI